MAARLRRVLGLAATAAVAVALVGLVVLRKVVPRRAEDGPQQPVWPPLEPLAAGRAAWVEPVAGRCPEGYPVKAKLGSGIFHLPGMLNYERCRPDRCYRSAEAAAADGLRAAKR